jgi:polysaccharide pyruvyl transferase WcaK-like protein
MKKITVLGNFSGRNAGDAAILGGLLRDIFFRYPEAYFYVPTINTAFVRRNFVGYPLKPVSLMPWHMSVKILGLPTWRSCLKSDLVLVTDAILFDRKLMNPLFNYLWTLSRVLPHAKKKGIPVVLYNCSLGPIYTAQGKDCLQRVLASADKVILRDRESRDLLDKLQLSHPDIEDGADCALNAQPVDADRFTEICAREKLFTSRRPVIGMNINSYVDAFVRQDGKTFGRENLIDMYAQTADRLIADLGVDIIFIETQHMDMQIAMEVMRKIRQTGRVRILSNRQYSYEELCAVLQRLDLFAGMRTHSLILSSAMGTPPVGIVTYPKNRGYMRTIGLENWLVDFRDLSAEAFYDKISKAFAGREEIKRAMLPKIQQEKLKAEQASEKLHDYLTIKY